MRIQVFGGSGFVGSEFTRQNPECLVNARDDYTVKEKNILYMISTVTNYHVKPILILTLIPISPH